MLDLTDFAVQERPEGNLMVAISRPWYNCSYTMAAKPIKSLELHYTMMQFLIISVIYKLFSFSVCVYFLLEDVLRLLYTSNWVWTLKLKSCADQTFLTISETMFTGKRRKARILRMGRKFLITDIPQNGKKKHEYIIQKHSYMQNSSTHRH